MKNTVAGTNTSQSDAIGETEAGFGLQWHIILARFDAQVAPSCEINDWLVELTCDKLYVSSATVILWYRDSMSRRSSSGVVICTMYTARFTDNIGKQLTYTVSLKPPHEAEP